MNYTEAAVRIFMDSSNRRELAEQVIEAAIIFPHADETYLLDLINTRLEERGESPWDTDHPGVQDTAREAMLRTRVALADNQEV